MTCERIPLHTQPQLAPVTVEQQRSLDDNQNEIAHQLALIARATARACGPYLRWARLQDLRVDNKSSEHDPVTVHDKAIETAITQILGYFLPGSRVLGEEHGEQLLPGGKPQLPERIQLPELEPHPDVRSQGSRVRWIVDPIDGTANFAAGMTYFNTSIAAELDGQVVAGAIHVPCEQETFWANAERGYLENERGFFALESSGPTREIEALLLTYHPILTQVKTHPEVTFEVLGQLIDTCRALRRPGAAALDLANIAAGRAGAFFATSVKPWDVAAGLHLVQVSGGTSYTHPMGTTTPAGFGPGVVAACAGLTTPKLKELLDQFAAQY